MTDHKSPPAPQLPDAYVMPKQIKECLAGIGTIGGYNDVRRTEVDAKLAVMVASELNRATHSITNNLIEFSIKIGELTGALESGALNATEELGNLTEALRAGATALNATVNTGNKLSQRIWWLNVLVVFLMLVQIWLGWKGTPTP